MNRIKPYAPALIWGIFIFVLSVWPGKDFPTFDWDDLLSLDKIVHFVFYFLLTGLIILGKNQAKKAGFTSPENRHGVRVSGLFILGTALFSAGYGWALEFIQEHFCTDRLFDVLDGIANTIGAAGAAIVFSVRWRGK